MSRGGGKTLDDIFGLFRASDNFNSIKARRSIAELATELNKAFNRSTNLIRDSNTSASIFNINDMGLDVIRRNMMVDEFGEEGVQYLDDVGKALRNDIDIQTNSVRTLNDEYLLDVNNSIKKNALIKETKRLDNLQNELDLHTKVVKSLNNQSDLIRYKSLKDKLKSTDESVEQSVERSKTFCKIEGNGKYCLAAVGFAGVGGYYTLESYNELEDEKKECLNICYPVNYKTGNVTYKLESDPDYKPLYDANLGDQICTPENMRLSGSTDCDDFCKKKCDYDITDLLENALENVDEDARKVSKGFLEYIKEWFVGGNSVWILLSISCLPLMIIVLLTIFKK